MNNFSPSAPPLPPDVTSSGWSELDAKAVLDYDAETETYQASIDWDNESVTLNVIAAVAAVSKTPPMELPSLHDAIDSDASDALTELTKADAARGDTVIALTYASYEVTIHGDGIISIRPSSVESTKNR